MQIPYYIDLLGTLVFAISGALAAFGKKLYQDIFGVSFTAFVTAIGGGTLRDIFLGVRPLAWIRDGNYIIAIIAGVLLTVFFKQYIKRIPRTLFLLDTVGVAIYTILGVQKSLALDVHPIAAIILGMVSAVFGGVLRDTLINEIPLIFKKEIYATACLAGAGLFVLLNYYKVDIDINFFSSVAFIIIIRVISVKYKIALPKLED
jgi:uncharacterized membrane protein YeiH